VSVTLVSTNIIHQSFRCRDERVEMSGFVRRCWHCPCVDIEGMQWTSQYRRGSTLQKICEYINEKSEILRTVSLRQSFTVKRKCCAYVVRLVLIAIVVQYIYSLGYMKRFEIDSKSFLLVSCSNWLSHLYTCWTMKSESDLCNYVCK
jgi:hypothetical protein